MDEEEVGASLARRAGVSNVLVLSPATENRRDCLSLLDPANAGALSVVGVTVGRTPDEWVADVPGALDDPPERVCVVAVGEETRSVAAGSPAPSSPSDACVKHVASPSNLTEVGVRLTECIEATEDAPGRLTLCFDSLSGVLPHVEGRTAFQFLHVLTGHVAASGGLAHYHLDPSVTDEMEVARLRTLFDAIVERDADGDVSVRTR